MVLLPALMLLLSPLLPLAFAYTGDMTAYTPGIGSCGFDAHDYDAHDYDAVVAISSAMMGESPDGNPNKNPKCRSKIGIWNPETKQKYEAYVVDTCKACGTYDIDVSTGLWNLIMKGEAPGRAHNIGWGGDAVGG